MIGFNRASSPKADQTITFAAISSKTYGDPPFTVSATASSGLSVSFSIFSGPAMITGNTVTITGAGTVVVRASQSGNASYNPAPDVDQGFAAAKANQTITFNPLPNKALGEPPFTVNATASSGLPVSFVIVSGSATISGNTVTMAGTGGVAVRALQDGNANYNPAPSIDQLFTVYSPSAVSLTQTGGNLMISWPTNVAGFVLEGAPSLTSLISWSPVSSTPVIVNGQYIVSVTVGTGNMFYRLGK